MTHLLNEPVKRMLAYLNSIFPVSAGLSEDLVEAVTYGSLKKGDYLLKAGEICKHVYFVDHGLLRVFNLYEDSDTKEEIDWSREFFRENEVCLMLQDFCNPSPSEDGIQALESTELICISDDDVKRIVERHKELMLFGPLIPEKYLVAQADKMKLVRLLEPAERSEALREMDPDLVKRVPGKYLFTYLHIWI